MDWLTPELVNGTLFVAFFVAVAGWVREVLGRRADRRVQRDQWDKTLEWEREKSQALRDEEHQRWKRDQCVQAYLEYRRLLEQFILQERSPAVFEKDVALLASIRNTEAALQFLMPALDPQPGEITTKVLGFREYSDIGILEAATNRVRQDLATLDQKVQADLKQIAQLSSDNY